MIHVCYGLHDKDGRYSKFTGTSMLSMLENYNTPPPRSITIYILHDNTLTADNMQKFVYIAGQYNQIVKFYNVEQICAEQIEEIRNMFPNVDSARVTLGTMYRLLICDLFDANIDKVIYLDSDIIVNLNISELWDIPLDDNPLAAVAESVADPRGFPEMSKLQHLITEKFVKYEDYFNAAVLSLNLVRIRRELDNIKEAMRFIAERPQFFCFDQDILNYCFATEYVKLPDKFDRFVARALERLSPQTHKPERAIYHYTGPDPTLDMNDALNRLYMSYFVKTPWFDVDAIGHLYEGTRQLHIAMKDFATRMSAMISGKTRAFFISSPDIEMLKRVFYVDASEEFITADSPTSLPKVIQSLREADGKKIFFILNSAYPIVRQLLMQNGFVEGKDFLNAAMFLSDAHGFPLNTYPMIKIL